MKDLAYYGLEFRVFKDGKDTERSVELLGLTDFIPKFKRLLREFPETDGYALILKSVNNY